MSKSRIVGGNEPLAPVCGHLPEPRFRVSSATLLGLVAEGYVHVRWGRG